MKTEFKTLYKLSIVLFALSLSQSEAIGKKPMYQTE